MIDLFEECYLGGGRAGQKLDPGKSGDELRGETKQQQEGEKGPAQSIVANNMK